MKRIVLTFGLIAGALLSLMMIVGTILVDTIGFDASEVIGYTTMVLAFLMVFFGIRSYRDNVAGGSISFGKAFGVGMLITLVVCVCYVATWEVIYYGGFAGDFMERYAAHQLEQARAGGATEAEIAKRTADMARFREMYRNPFINAGLTFIEVFPVGLVMTLVSAAILGFRPHRGRADEGVGSAAS